jgi:hypothetical protein
MQERFSINQDKKSRDIVNCQIFQVFGQKWQVEKFIHATFQKGIQSVLLTYYLQHFNQ